MNPFLRLAGICLLALLCVGATCKSNIIEDPSAFALEAGESTLLLGSSCSQPIQKGYATCKLKRGQKLPLLLLYFVNPAEYAVGDCTGGVFHTGEISVPGEASVDLTPLNDEAYRSGFCFLRIEAIEYYSDPRDKNQKRQIPLSGGFFIEFLAEDYYPDPPSALTSWCYKVRGTNKGRRRVEACVNGY